MDSDEKVQEIQDDTPTIEDRVVGGDPQAIATVLAALLPRLVKRAHLKLWRQPQAREEAEDAAVSAIRTFLRRRELGEFPCVSEAEDLYRLLALITCRKAAKRWVRQRRYVGESEFDPNSAVSLVELLSCQPPEQDFAVYCDELLDVLPGDSHRKIVAMLISGCQQQEIAAALDCSTRLIRYRLTEIRRVWKKFLLES